jgi:uracil-DNA glycosylase family 4
MHTPSNDYEWRRCKSCRLYASRRFVVLRRTGYVSRGVYIDGTSIDKYPTVLFIGEAPGAQEDHTGLPFRGSSGRILHTIWHHTATPFNYHLINLVGCRPTEEDFRGNTVNREPTPPEIEACRPRLEQEVANRHFDGVVYLGKLATKFIPKQFNGPPNLFIRGLELIHPAAILRMEYKVHTIKTQALLLENYLKTLEKK